MSNVQFQRTCLAISLISLSICWLSINAPSFGEEVVTPHHLVGHEEAPLLQRVQDVIDDWDPRKLVNPLVVTSEAQNANGKLVVRKQLRRPDLAQFIADVDAVEALGKAFFWEMQAGSDFRQLKDGTMIGTACASCHYRHGADARSRHTIRIPWVAWDQYKLHNKHPLEFGQRQEPFPVAALAVKEVPFQNLQPAGPFSLIVGSQGVGSRVFKEFKDEGDVATGKWKSEVSEKRPLVGFKHLPDWAMFLDADFKLQGDGTYIVTERARFRQITTRNSPSVINSGFSDRLFHDGRAESTFNGFSIFGDADPREVIHRRRVLQTLDEDGRIVKEIVDIAPVKIAITKAALASQAVGPVVNEVEMSYLGRQFPNLAHKLLDAQILRFQDVSPTDSVLGGWPVGKKADTITYKALIQRAFRREWWDDSGLTDPKLKTPLVLLRDCEEDGNPHGLLMEANFSLYWGLAIMFYESSLVSNQSPFDDMMRGRTEKVEAKWEAVKTGNGPDDKLQPIRRDQRTPQPPPEHVSGSAVFQHGFRVFLNRGCVDCHDGPLMSELYERLPELEKFPIHHEIERALLPNSRADALAINLREARGKLITSLSGVVNQKLPSAAHRAEKVAIELEGLRDSGQGERRLLFSNALAYLDRAFPSVDSDVRRAVAHEVANRLFRFEKQQPGLFGNRTFFTEDERIAMAEAIVDPVLIEKMPIPVNQTPFRPRLPIAGPLANEFYAFYDLGFYTLGVSLPRYDRGIGEKNNLDTIEDALDGTISSFSESIEPVVQEVAIAVKKALTHAQLTKGRQAAARQIIDSISKGELKLNDDAKKRFLDDIKQRVVPSSSTPGSAYRFNRKWHGDRYKSQLKSGSSSKDADAPQPAVPGGGEAKIRTSALGPLIDLDKEINGKHFDTSWDRSDIPYGIKADENDPDFNKNEIVPGPGRRSSYYFRSRARRLVSSEEHWGYRKPFLHDNELAFWGSFKTPTLRNVELTAPYMHNGRFMTLMDVVEFYEDLDTEEPGEVRRQLPRSLLANPDKHPAIEDIDLNDSDKRALVFFLLCLTDDRVRREQGPFDHPAINIVNGYKSAGTNAYEDDLIAVPSTGAQGHPEFARQFPASQ